MKKTKSWIAAGMAAVMLCGCGSQGAVEGSASDGQTQGENHGEETSQYPDYLNLDSMRPIVKDGEKITLSVMVKRESIANSDINENWFVKFLDEKMNIQLEIEEVNESTYEERRNLVLVSDEMPDIMINTGLTANDIVTYGQSNEQLLPLSDYINEELTPNIVAALEGQDAAVTENTAPDGKMYTLPTFLPSYPGQGDTLGMQRVFIDTKYMEAAGIEEVPTTLDDFVEMLRAFKALDPAEMGVDVIYPMVSTWGNDKEILQNAFGWITTGNDLSAPAWDVETNDMVIPCTQEKYKDYVTLLNTLYTEELIHPDFFTIDKEAARALYAEGKVPVICDAAAYLSLPERENEFVSAIPLSSEWTENGVTKATAGYTLGNIVVSADTEYPEVCMRLLDYLYSPEGSIYCQYGAPAGSEDCMGIIEGFELAEDGTIVYKDVESGKYESQFDYTVNGIELSQNTPRDDRKTILNQQEMLGVENPEFPDFDLSDPDQHYRKECYEAHQGHMVEGLPSMYLDTDTAARYMDLYTVIKNYVDSETAKFVVGQRPLEELDQFQEELKDMNVDEYVTLCHDYYADYVETRNSEK
ncbi:MAG: extracellular solute-binding protein [Lachnospiraceae bacterium]